MANYVLVHGAWGGGHSYDRTLEDLTAAGHNVLVCALRGLGIRQSELHPGITLSDHADDVCEQIAQAGFDRFVLVGHSYGGMVITMVATRLGARIDAICYLDAFLPLDGQSAWDITGEAEHDWYIDKQRFTPGLLPPIRSIDFTVVPGRVGLHPLLTLLEAVQFTGEEAKIPRRAYVFASGWQPTPFTPFRDRVKHDPAWEYHESESSHHVMSDQPQQVLDILLGLAS
ncbi:pimeloyl-ACP methyl ester carboxylesterase [Altererythrobacter atlanticus]|uniref:Acyl-CoA esterase n=1 Tax=Croceibacterium atlanticum TaxID=1267766 RepID=A0A0F7KW12_9SPHN|nr:alpha/beta hydrolase [Croceibacterium atlanticum]AKH42965.1 acyl-CoA esterase [Croceibacterium atlanticum]MBB5734078.1 pimeloyl-ACP methyl ester carboxylesterase [Croceibacterium atlanticum]